MLVVSDCKIFFQKILLFIVMAFGFNLLSTATHVDEINFSTKNLEVNEPRESMPLKTSKNNSSEKVMVEKKTPNVRKYTSYYEKLPPHIIDGVFLLAFGAAIYAGWDLDLIPLFFDYLLPFFVGILGADFITASIHFLEDINDDHLPKDSIICPNRNHHHVPREIVETPFLNTILLPSIIVSPFLIGAIYTGMPDFIVYSIGLSAFGNWVHQMAHHTEKEVWELSRIVWALQRIGIMQSQKEHKKHHYPGLRKNEDGEEILPYLRNTHYSVFTNFLNKPLEAINFWRHVEKGIEYTTGIKPKTLDDNQSYLKYCHKKDPSKWHFLIDRVKENFLKKRKRLKVQDDPELEE